VPIHIFTRQEILDALAIARKYGLELKEELDLRSSGRVATWKKYGLSYTFVIFSLRKSN
jgi:hypothetical protein